MKIRGTSLPIRSLVSLALLTALPAGALQPASTMPGHEEPLLLELPVATVTAPGGAVTSLRPAGSSDDAESEFVLDGAPREDGAPLMLELSLRQDEDRAGAATGLDVRVTDADGRGVDARILGRGDFVKLLVSDANARYPLTLRIRLAAYASLDVGGDPSGDPGLLDPILIDLPGPAPMSGHLPCDFLAIAASSKPFAPSGYSVAVGTDRLVYAWGTNGFGQLGTGSGDQSARPREIPGIGDVAGVAAGGGHVLALKTDGSVWSWGLNDQGQLGIGSLVNTPVPTHVVIPGNPVIVAIAAGLEHSLALTDANVVWAWGRNQNGQLGNGTTNRETSPVAVVGLSTATGIAAGARHSVAVTSLGEVWTWGHDDKGQLGDGLSNAQSSVPVQAVTPPDIVAIAAGAEHCLALRGNGDVHAWGDNTNGQLGDGTTTMQVIPVPIVQPGPIDAIAAGGNSSQAIRPDETGLAWGRNAFGELGDGTRTQRLTPVAIVGLAGVANLACGDGHAIALTTGGRVYTWGSPYSGHLGNEAAAYSPEILRTHGALNEDFLLDVDDLALGGVHSLAVKDGIVYAWGRNNRGQLGDGTTTDRDAPVQVNLLTNVVKVAAGGEHSLALKADGSVWAWGSNNLGKLGDNTMLQRNEPVQVVDIPGTGFLSGVAAIAAGDDHSLALLTTGAVLSWGSDVDGQLGNGGSGQRSRPGSVVGLGSGSFVGVIAAGGSHSLAAKPVSGGGDGRIWAWGRNDKGQLGDGTSTLRQSPVPITNANFVANCSTVGVDGGDAHSVAWCTNGKAWVWGNGTFGQLGNGLSTNKQMVPIEPSLAGALVSEMSAGARHVLALMTTGTVRAWGTNSKGELGDGTFATRSPPLPAAVSGLTGVMHVRAGGAAAGAFESHSFATTAAGGTWAWGAGLTGQLGVGEVIAQVTPVRPQLGPQCENQAPTCNAGPDQIVSCDGVQLEGSAVDADGDPMTFLWTTPCQATFAPGNDVLDPVVTFGEECGVSCELTLTVTDSNEASCFDTVQIDVDDVDAPTPVETRTIADCFATAAEAEAAARGAVDWTDDCVQLTELAEVIPGCEAAVYVSAVDGCGNESEPVEFLTRIDGIAPALSGVPANATVECDAIPDPPAVDATDNCDGAVPVVYVQVSVPGACIGSSTITRTWSAQDECSNSVSAQQVLTVVDTTAPVFSGVPADATAECSEVPDPPIVTVSDNCDPNPALLFASVRHDGDCAGRYTIVNSWQAFDDCGNAALASQTLTVVDTTPPVISGVPADTTAPCDDVPPPASPTASDLCDPLPTIALSTQIVQGTCPDAYDIVHTWTATDECGNDATATQTIAVSDQAPPILHGVPDDATVECDSIPPPATPTATDNCDPAPGIALIEATTAGSCPASYTLSRTWTATDRCGNAASRTQVITVVDTTDPVLSGVPGDISVECDSVPDPPIVTATDNCGPAVVTLAETTTPGPCEDTYVLHRTWTAVDGCGNDSSATQNITVADTTDPVLHGVPFSMTVECDAVPDPPVVTATDNCDPAAVVDYAETRLNGVCLDSYALLRTWTATDRCGNSVSATQTLTVRDITPPVLSGVPADTTVDCNEVPPPASPTAADTCDPSPTITFFESRINGACPDRYTLARTWTATDRCGNALSGAQYIVVTDNIKPTLSPLPGDVTVECDAIPPARVATATDNCDPAPVVTFTQVRGGGSCGGNYTLTRTWTATDRCGNSSSHVQVVTAIDTQPPIVTTGADDLYCLWPANHQYRLFTKSMFSPTISDNCSAISWRFVGCGSSQPDDIRGGNDGNTIDDCVVDPEGAWFKVRGENDSKKPPGRRYKITIVATDACGNEGTPAQIGFVYAPIKKPPEGCLEPNGGL